MKSKYLWILDSCVILLLTGMFSWLYLTNHAWGAWGDDSPGYIYTAGQFLKHEPLVVQDTLVQQALIYFGQEKLARLAAPTHHEIISPQGWIASRYPIGLSWLMYLVAKVTGSDEAIYTVVPTLGVGVVALTYLLTIVLIPQHTLTKRAMGIMAALAVGFSDLYASHTVAQPMREIPSMFFFLLALLVLLWGIKYNPLLFISGLLYGYSINIRETSAILIIPIIILLTQVERKQWLRLFSIFGIGMIIAGSLSLWNSSLITAHKEKFREKDITNIAITANIDHIRSLSIINLYDNEGKFKPGVGGASQYWEVLTEFSLWSPFLFFAAVGLIFLWFQDRRVAYAVISWITLVFLLFGMWINPYARYILPLFPAVAIVSAYGTVLSLAWVRQRLTLRFPVWVLLIIIVIGSFFASLQPLIAERISHIQTSDYVYKAISHNDLEQLRSVANTIKEQSATKPPLLIMIGIRQAGISEILMTHTNGVRVIRYPRKPQEQPSVEAMTGFLKQLSEQYQLFLWYDNTASPEEQQLRQRFVLEQIEKTQFTFQPDVSIYKIQP